MKSDFEVKLHPHALKRLPERGALEQEVKTTVLNGETFPVKHSRTGFRCNFSFENNWQGKYYQTKQIEAYAVFENDSWLVITIIVKYF